MGYVNGWGVVGGRTEKWPKMGRGGRWVRGRERKTDRPVGGMCADKVDTRMAGWEGRGDREGGGADGWVGRWMKERGRERGRRAGEEGWEMGSWPAGTAAAGAGTGPQSRPTGQGGRTHLMPVSRAPVPLHLRLHPLQVGLQEALELFAVTDFVLEGAAVIHHRVHPVHVDELWGGHGGQGRGGRARLPLGLTLHPYPGRGEPRCPAEAPPHLCSRWPSSPRGPARVPSGPRLCLLCYWRPQAMDVFVSQQTTFAPYCILP